MLFKEICSGIRAFIQSNELEKYKNESTENIASIILTGDILAKGKQIKSTMDFILGIPNLLFWDKVRRFLYGNYQDFEWQIKMSQRFDSDEEWQDYAKRLLHIINQIDDDKKIDYLRNLTQALALNLIDLPLYFKSIKILQSTTREELQYLSENINNSRLCDNGYIYSLVSNGLVETFIVDNRGNISIGGANQYRCTAFAHIIDKFAIHFRNENKHSYNTGIVKMVDLK